MGKAFSVFDPKRVSQRRGGGQSSISLGLVLLALAIFFGCGRTDFRAFDDGGEAGDGGTNSGGTGGNFTGGSFTGGSFTGGTTFTGGTGGFCNGRLALCGNECVDPLFDPSHCGGCFYQCGFDQACLSGTCVTQCSSGTFCSGICTDLGFDALNCGRCGNVCELGEFCNGGFCASPCGDELLLCEGECHDPSTDSDHCGSCGISCDGNHGGFCDAGRCRCGGGQVTCGGACVDLRTNLSNCGACGVACAEGETCIDGKCSLACGPGFTDCSGVCRDLRGDPQNCGGCGRQCGMRQICSNGACAPGPDGFGYAVGPSPLSFVNACEQPGRLILTPNQDDAAAQVMLPFSFRFFGNTVSSGWVSSNGLLGFGAATIEFDNECNFNDMGHATRNTVLAFWDDLMTRASGVCVATIGSAPNRQFVATWNDAALLAFDVASHLTFSVVLSETSDVIDVLYGAMIGPGSFAAGSSASVGISNATRYTLECCNQPCVSSNSGRRYSPILR